MTRATTSGHRRVVRQAPEATQLSANQLGDRSDMSQACELLSRAASVVLLAHVSPDADALGSALALGLGLERAGTDVVVAFSEPASVPESLRGLPGQHLVRPAVDVPRCPDLVVTLDVNSRERLGSLASLLDTANDSLVIDHHASNTRFGNHHLVEISAESTTVLVATILDRLGVPIDRDIAANIYAGVATDTVGFRFASAGAHRLSARLLDAGVNPDELMRPITDIHPFSWLDMLSQVLGAAVLDPNAAGGRGLVTSVITQETARGLRPEELDSVIDILRTASEAQVAAVLKETGPDQWQISLRSRPGVAADSILSGVDVAAVATRLGGGGHVRAAGFGFTGTSAEGIAALTDALQD